MKPIFSFRYTFGIVLLLASGVILLWAYGRRGKVESTVKRPHSAEVKSAPIFKDVTKSVGLSFRHWCGDSGKYFVPESMGSGIALLDYDRDGDLDIFVVQGMPLAAANTKSAGERGFSSTSRLYRQTLGKFEDVTVSVGLDDETPYGMGVAVGDVNNDGWPDLFVSKYGKDRLFLNHEGRFEDVTLAAGIDNPRWGTSCCFIDYDRDGWLDLFIVNYYDYYESKRLFLPNGQEDYAGPALFDPVSARLYRNLSGEGTDKKTRFKDVSFETGIDAKPGPGLGVLPSDFNGDGWIDFYVANDGKANFLWLSRGGKTFADDAIQSGAAYSAAGVPQASMGVTAGDVDGDGKTDIFMTHLEGEYSTLYLQVAQSLFEDRTAGAGLAAPTIPTTGFGTALFDIDLDGDLDLIIGNGRVRRRDGAATGKGADFWKKYTEPNQIFLNDGMGVFAEAAAGEDGFLAEARVTRGLAVGDLDNDGDLDVVTSEVNGPARVFLNSAKRQGNWLSVRAIDPRYGGRDAYGATVTVTAGKHNWSREINPAYSYLSSNDPRAHFGMGSESTYDQIEVRWPDGKREKFKGGSAGSSLTLLRGQGQQP